MQARAKGIRARRGALRLRPVAGFAVPGNASVWIGAAGRNAAPARGFSRRAFGETGMFSIVRRGSEWVLRADESDIMRVRTKALARRIVRDAAARAQAPAPAARAVERRAEPPP